jgi:hypothetical protein
MDRGRVVGRIHFKNPAQHVPQTRMQRLRLWIRQMRELARALFALVLSR